LLGTPCIRWYCSSPIRYGKDETVKNQPVRTISREVGEALLTPQRPHAELLEARMKIWSTPHGDVGTNVNKVAVPEGAAGSPPF
jgi:hypothetical protein